MPALAPPPPTHTHCPTLWLRNAATFRRAVAAAAAPPLLHSSPRCSQLGIGSIHGQWQAISDDRQKVAYRLAAKMFIHAHADKAHARVFGQGQQACTDPQPPSPCCCCYYCRTVTTTTILLLLLWQRCPTPLVLRLPLMPRQRRHCCTAVHGAVSWAMVAFMASCMQFQVIDKQLRTDL